MKNGITLTHWRLTFDTDINGSFISNGTTLIVSEHASRTSRYCQKRGNVLVLDIRRARIYYSFGQPSYKNQFAIPVFVKIAQRCDFITSTLDEVVASFGGRLESQEAAFYRIRSDVKAIRNVGLQRNGET